MPLVPRGQIAVPIMFRLTPLEYEYIINHAECKAFIVEEPFVEGVNSVRGKLNCVLAVIIFTSVRVRLPKATFIMRKY